METSKVELIMQKFQNNIPREYLSNVRTDLEKLSDLHSPTLYGLPVKSKIKTLVFSIFFGGLGVDRFYLGDKGLGTGKLLLRIVSTILSMVVAVDFVYLLGSLVSLVASIWCFVDIFLCYKAAKDMNYTILSETINRCISIDKKNRENELKKQNAMKIANEVQNKPVFTHPIKQENTKTTNMDVVNVLTEFSSRLKLKGISEDVDVGIRFNAKIYIKKVEANLVFLIQPDIGKVLCQFVLGNVKDILRAREIIKRFNDKYGYESDDMSFFIEIKEKTLDGCKYLQLASKAEFSDEESLDDILSEIMGKILSVTDAEYDELCAVVFYKGEKNV